MYVCVGSLKKERNNYLINFVEKNRSKNDDGSDGGKTQYFYLKAGVDEWANALTTRNI